MYSTMASTSRFAFCGKMMKSTKQTAAMSRLSPSTLVTGTFFLVAIQVMMGAATSAQFLAMMA